MRWVWALLLLASCVTVVCEAPYMNYEEGCCLDVDNNSICDEHEPEDTIEEKIPRPTLREQANDLARFMDLETHGKIYDLLTGQRKTLMSREDFIDLYPPVVYGTQLSIVGNTVDLTISNNPVLATHVVSVNETSGSVQLQYQLRDKVLFEEPLIAFSNETGTWRLEGFDKLLHAACYETPECGSEVLQDACQWTCQRRKKMDALNTYDCRARVCHCQCWEEGRDQYTLPPEFGNT